VFYSVVHIITGLTRGQPGKPFSIPDRGEGFFSFPKYPDRLWSTPSLLFHEYWELFPREVRRLEHEAEYLFPFNPELQNKRSYVSTLPACFDDVRWDSFTIGGIQWLIS